jgi:hypothetical protein
MKNFNNLEIKSEVGFLLVFFVLVDGQGALGLWTMARLPFRTQASSRKRVMFFPLH